MSSSNIQLGSLTKLAKEEQWVLWLEDLTDVIYLNGLEDFYSDIVEKPTGAGTQKE
jgi:hypothetical protein